MTILILGLSIFLGVHSARIVADGWRSSQIARYGENRWKGIYSLLSAIRRTSGHRRRGRAMWPHC